MKNRWMGGHTDIQTDRVIDGQTHGWMDGKTDRPIDRLQTYGHMYGWMHLRTGEETGRLTDYGRITNRRTDGQAGRQRTDI